MDSDMFDPPPMKMKQTRWQLVRLAWRATVKTRQSPCTLTTNEYGYVDLFVGSYTSTTVAPRMQWNQTPVMTHWRSTTRTTRARIRSCSP
jgi:hypothetical protein